MITLLNTSILTGGTGTYRLERADLEDARDAVQVKSKLVYTDRPAEPLPAYQSAVGHQSTAAIFAELLGVPVEVNRIEWRQTPGDRGLVLKVKGRPPEGKILSREEIEEAGYDLFWLDMLEEIEVHEPELSVVPPGSFVVLERFPHTYRGLVSAMGYAAQETEDGGLLMVCPAKGMPLLAFEGGEFKFGGWSPSIRLPAVPSDAPETEVLLVSSYGEMFDGMTLGAALAREPEVMHGEVVVDTSKKFVWNVANGSWGPIEERPEAVEWVAQEREPNSGAEERDF